MIKNKKNKTIFTPSPPQPAIDILPLTTWFVTKPTNLHLLTPPIYRFLVKTCTTVRFRTVILRSDLCGSSCSQKFIGSSKLAMSPPQKLHFLNFSKFPSFCCAPSPLVVEWNSLLTGHVIWFFAQNNFFGNCVKMTYQKSSSLKIILEFLSFFLLKFQTNVPMLPFMLERILLRQPPACIRRVRNYGGSSVMTNQISNLTEQSFLEICRKDQSLNETVWTLKYDKLHVFDLVDELKRKRLLIEYYLCIPQNFMKQKLIHFACVNY